MGVLRYRDANIASNSIVKKEKSSDSPKLKIKDLHKSERPREKLMESGVTSLTNAELLGVILGSGSAQMNSISLAQLILNDCEQNLDVLAKFSLKDFQRFSGVGEAKAIAIISALELSRRRNSGAKLSANSVYNNAESIYKLMREELIDKVTEEFWLVLLNSSNKLIKKQCISKGGLNTTIVDPRVLFKTVIDYSAVGVVMVHNHPSGNPNPSRRDIEITKKMVEGSKYLDINIIDHIIISASSYYSFADEGLLFNE